MKGIPSPRGVKLPVSRAVVAAVLVVALAMVCWPGFAQTMWTENGVVVREILNSNVQGCEIAHVGSGSTIIAWEDLRNGGAGHIFAQKLNASGACQWTANGVAIFDQLGATADDPQVISDGDGGAIITWYDGRDGCREIYAQRVDSGGNVLWTPDGERITNIPDPQQAQNPQLVSDGSGGAIITWQDNRAIANINIYAQRVDGEGNVQWPANGVTIREVAGSSAEKPQIASDGSGGAIITWQDQRGGQYDIYAQKVDSDGNTQWANNGELIRTVAGSSATKQQIISDGLGGAIITWQDARSGVEDIYARRIDSDGNALWTEQGNAIRQLGGSDAEKPQIAADGSNGAIITWFDGRSPGGNYDIYAQRVKKNGDTLWDNDGEAIRNVPGSSAREPQIAGDGEGGAVIAWRDQRNGNWQIYAQKVNGDATPYWDDNGAVVCDVATSQDQKIAPDGDDGAVVAWGNNRANNDLNLYAQRLEGKSTILPYINSIDPTSGTTGTTLSIYGTDFGDTRGESYVSVGSLEVSNYTSWSSTEVVCKVPGAAYGKTTVSLTNEAGESNTRSFSVIPKINSISPSSGPVGAQLVIKGTAFGPEQDTSYVSFNGVRPDDDEYVDWANKQVKVRVPTFATTGPVTVHTSAGESDGVDFTVTSTTPNNFYFAEGSCRPGFDPYICIQNPGYVNAYATITFMKGDGSTATEERMVEPNSRETVVVKDVLGEADDEAHDFSCQVSTETEDEEIIVERPMYFNYKMDYPGYGWSGGHDVIGALSPATEFYFAEGTCRPGFDPYLCIQNPNESNASVKITYMKGDGTTEEQNLTVPASSRSTVVVKDTLGEADDEAHDFSAKVESTNQRGILVERPMYFNYGGQWPGGHDVIGANSPATEFYFAEGTCRPGFDPYLCIQNPGGTDAQVTITYMKGDGTVEEEQRTVEARSRETVVVKEKLGEADDAAHDFSTKVECTNGQSIIAERPMYFNYKKDDPNYGWTGGHDVIGALVPAKDFYFAEGTCRPGYEPYLCIQNPGEVDASVMITYMKGNGQIDMETRTVRANSRETVVVKDRLGEADDAAHDFSAKVQCTNNQQIIVERPMYFCYKMGWPGFNWTGGHDVIGFVMN